MLVSDKMWVEYPYNVKKICFSNKKYDSLTKNNKVTRAYNVLMQ